MSQKTAGFASPAQGYEEEGIDLNRLLIRNPPATIYVRLESGDMESLGLAKGAVLIVDRSIVPAGNSLVMLRHEGQFLCRLMVKRNGRTVFTNGTSEISPVVDETEIIGVITASIKVYSNPHLNSL
jgi:DNA polymerase V